MTPYPSADDNHYQSSFMRNPKFNYISSLGYLNESASNNSLVGQFLSCISMLTKDMQGYCSAPRAARLQAPLRSILKARDPIHHDAPCKRQTRTAVNAQLLHLKFQGLTGSQILHGIEPHKILGFTVCAIASDCRSLLDLCC